jgi:uncharacterized membrane protein YphA (DoxX/SURF4 family)
MDLSMRAGLSSRLEPPHLSIGPTLVRLTNGRLSNQRLWRKAMNLTLWILQVVLALVFLAHGLMFLAPPPEIAVQMDALLPRWFQLFLGVAEVLAAVGLTLPGVTRIMPALVPGAAAGVMIVTVSATLLHLWRAELSSAAITLVLLLIATFVGYGRWRWLPITPRRAER